MQRDSSLLLPSRRSTHTLTIAELIHSLREHLLYARPCVYLPQLDQKHLELVGVMAYACFFSNLSPLS